MSSTVADAVAAYLAQLDTIKYDDDAEQARIHDGMLKFALALQQHIAARYEIELDYSDVLAGISYAGADTYGWMMQNDTGTVAGVKLRFSWPAEMLLRSDPTWVAWHKDGSFVTRDLIAALTFAATGRE